MRQQKSDFTSKKIRDVEMKLLNFNRSLDLCARMNYETENLDFIDEIPEASVMYDLGACEGRFSVYAAHKGIEVYAFEPESLNFETFSRNKALNELPDEILHIFQFGVAEETKTGTMNIGQPWAGGHQKIVKHTEIVRQDLNFDFVDEQRIELISLDNFIQMSGLPEPDFMKIDIDGSEIPFMKGASKTLKNPSLKKIIFELNKSDSSYQSIIDQLLESGLVKMKEFQVPNEPGLFNIIFKRTK